MSKAISGSSSTISTDLPEKGIVPSIAALIPCYALKNDALVCLEREPLGESGSSIYLRSFARRIKCAAVSAFIPPSEPVEESVRPSGKGWCHEVKFDGYRLQLVKDGDRAFIWSKNGKDFTARFRDIAKAVTAMPCKSCVIDAEGVALDAEGRPDFRALVGGQKHSRVAWCFDLLEVDGRDMRAFPLVTRRVRLRALLVKRDTTYFATQTPSPIQ
jgi:ATP-dependent DNA ligase